MRNKGGTASLRLVRNAPLISKFYLEVGGAFFVSKKRALVAQGIEQLFSKE